jgi:hypothetical protein
VTTSPELLFCGGSVFDGAGFLPPGTRVRVRGSTIVEVGDRLVVGRAQVVDLDGATLLPGFIDAHIHPVFAGDRLRTCDLSPASSAAGYLDIVSRYARAHPERAWITGGGWAATDFAGGRPTREALDAVVPDRPAYLVNQDGHGTWVNSAALTAAGIDHRTADPADGRIDRDRAGRPTGLLHEGASDLVSRLLPARTDDDWYQALLVAQSHLLALGITGWQDAIVGSYAGADDPMPAYLRAAGNGALLVDVVGALWWDRERGAEQIEELTQRRAAGQLERFRATTVKLMLDGVPETHTAAMLEPYADADHNRCSADVGTGEGLNAAPDLGLDLIDPAAVPAYVTALDALGFAAHFHAIGDRAVRGALDAVAAARAANGPRGARHHIAHVQVVHPDDRPRFAALGTTANIQPLWAAHDAEMDELTIPALGEQRSQWL